jgi:hypothetical protein
MKFSSGHLPWNKGICVTTNTGITRFKKGNIPWNKNKVLPSVSEQLRGREISKETKDKIRNSLRRGSELTCKECPNIFWASPSKIKAGAKFCSIRCMSQANKRRSVSQKQREQIAQSRMGSKNPMWKDGRTSDVRRIRNHRQMKLWKAAVLKRDDYVCGKCKKRGGRLEADHYPRPFRDLIRDIVAIYGIASLYKQALKYTPLWDKTNGRTLCYVCHRGKK